MSFSVACPSVSSMFFHPIFIPLLFSVMIPQLCKWMSNIWEAKTGTNVETARKLWWTEQATDFYGQITEDTFPIV
jgi:hypothetical protein